MDLVFALTVMTLLCVSVMAWVAWRLRPPQTTATKMNLDTPSERTTAVVSRAPSIVLTAAVLAALVILYATHDRLFWARFLPFSAVIIWSEVTAVALAVASGAAFRLPNRPSWRRVISGSLLAVLTLGTLYEPLVQRFLRPVMVTHHWEAECVCMQTNANTCSAAAGATLLKAHGLDLSEAEMVKLCLTNSHGTPSLGLWRGLSIATSSSHLKPKVIHTDIESLLTQGPWPVALVVGVPRFGADSGYAKKYGWDPGYRHSIVLFGRCNDAWLGIGDPSAGYARWSDDDLRVLWRGEGIALVER